MEGREGEAGFTLPETLIALTLMALLFGALASALQLGLTAWRVSKEMDQLTETHATREFLRHALASARPVRVRDEDGKLIVAFKAEKDRLEFVTALPERHVKAGLYWVKVRQKAEESRRDLAIEIMLFENTNNAPPSLKKTDDKIQIKSSINIHSLIPFRKNLDSKMNF